MQNPNLVYSHVPTYQGSDDDEKRRRTLDHHNLLLDELDFAPSTPDLKKKKGDDLRYDTVKEHGKEDCKSSNDENTNSPKSKGYHSMDMISAADSTDDGLPAYNWHHAPKLCAHEEGLFTSTAANQDRMRRYGQWPSTVPIEVRPNSSDTEMPSHPPKVKRSKSDGIDPASLFYRNNNFRKSPF